MTNTKKRRTGPVPRPADQVKGARLDVRAKPGDLAAWGRAGDALGMSRNAWVEMILNRAAKGKH